MPLAVPGTHRAPAHRIDLDHHPASAVGAVARRLQGSSRNTRGMWLIGKPAALATVNVVVRRQLRHPMSYSVADNALIGIFSSANRSMSDSAGRPSVVR